MSTTPAPGTQAGIFARFTHPAGRNRNANFVFQLPDGVAAPVSSAVFRMWPSLPHLRADSFDSLVVSNSGCRIANTERGSPPANHPTLEPNAPVLGRGFAVLGQGFCHAKLHRVLVRPGFGEVALGCRNGRTRSELSAGWPC